ncbi:hypothetical protein [Nocardia brasiliensis]
MSMAEDAARRRREPGTTARDTEEAGREIWCALAELLRAPIPSTFASLPALGDIRKALVDFITSRSQQI